MFTSPIRLRTCVRGALAIAGAASVVACTDDATAPLVRAPRAALSDVTPTIVVTNTNDAGAGSLRQAIVDAVGGDVIGFAASIAGQTITLSTGQIEVTKPITVQGPQTKGMVINGGGAAPVFTIDFPNEVALRNLTITNGKGGLDANGGGINVAGGRLTLDHSLVTGNSVGNAGGGIFVDGGGTLTVTNTTITKNSAMLGGGIYVNSGTAEATNTTITDNTAFTGGGVRSNGGATSASFTFRNTIVALNHNGGDCELSGTTTFTGMNIAGDNSCSALPNPFLIIAADPKLAALADNGGPTQTQALLAGSPAIDAATNCTVNDDQRYVTRPLGAACDIGAYELDGRPRVTVTIDGTAAVNPSTGTAIVTGTVTCSEAVAVQLRVGLAQVQKIRRVSTTVQASDVTTVDCVTAKVWGIALTPASGAFLNTTASATATTLNASSQLAPLSTTADVKLYWGRK